jgi:hypothetical protein
VLAALGGAVNDYKCGGTEALSAWVARADVRKALNVPANSVWNNVDGEWKEYHSTAKDLRPYYREWASGTHAELGLRVLIYSGDADPGGKLRARFVR